MEDFPDKLQVAQNEFAQDILAQMREDQERKFAQYGSPHHLSGGCSWWVQESDDLHFSFPMEPRDINGIKILYAMNNAPDTAAEEGKKLQKKTRDHFLRCGGCPQFFPMAQDVDAIGRSTRLPIVSESWVRLDDNAYYHCHDGFLLPLLIAKENAFEGRDKEQLLPGNVREHFTVCPIMSDDFRLYHDLMRKVHSVSERAYYNLFNRRYVCWSSFRRLRFCPPQDVRPHRLDLGEFQNHDAWFQKHVYDYDESDDESDRRFLAEVEKRIVTGMLQFLCPAENAVLRRPFKDACITYDHPVQSLVHARAVRKRPLLWEDLCVGFTLKD